jgi:hypothetical protein
MRSITRSRSLRRRARWCPSRFGRESCRAGQTPKSMSPLQVSRVFALLLVAVLAVPASAQAVAPTSESLPRLTGFESEPNSTTATATPLTFVSDAKAFGNLGGVIRVNAQTGARSTASSNSAPAGSTSFVNPVGIALEPTS